MEHLKIMKREWSAEQGTYVYDAIADSAGYISNLPDDCGFGSSCICPDGIYFLFPTKGWQTI